jgi:hypothetical protein
MEKQYKTMQDAVTKDLAAKRKALAAAEKRVIKAEAEKQELAAEVYRLEGLEKSLQMVNDKTPIQIQPNIIYVYPNQWTYYPVVQFPDPFYQKPFVPNFPLHNGGIGITPVRLTTTVPVPNNIPFVSGLSVTSGNVSSSGWFTNVQS